MACVITEISRRVYPSNVIIAFYKYVNGGADTGGSITPGFRVAFAKVIEYGAAAHANMASLNSTLPANTITFVTAAGADGYVWVVSG